MVGEPSPTVVLLSAGRVPAVDRMVDELSTLNRPGEVYARLANTQDDKGGIVVLANADANGEIGTVQTFDLRAEGNNATNAQALAQRRRRCLIEAVQALPAIEMPPLEVAEGEDVSVTEPDVVTSIGRAVEAGARQAGSKPVVVVVMGLSRSNLGGKVIARVDLRDEVRSEVLDRFAAADVRIPEISRPDTAVRFVAPSEGLPTHLQPGMVGLANDICSRLNVDDCTVAEGV